MRDDPWLFSAIYTSLDNVACLDLWRELENIKNRYMGPWLLAGDLNGTKTVSERNANGGTETEMKVSRFLKLD